MWRSGRTSVIEGRVVIGPRTVVGPYTMVKGHAVIGAGCRLGPGAFIGLDPQHRGYSGQETSVEIGEGCIIREGASVHRAYQPGHATRIGPRCMLMGQSHIGHDSVLGADVTLANSVIVGGHCRIGDGVFLGGGCGIHQYVPHRPARDRLRQRGGLAGCTRLCGGTLRRAQGI